VSGGVPVNTWTHVCVVYDNRSASNLPVFYANGFNAGAVTTVVAPTGSADSDAPSPLYLGLQALLAVFLR